MKATADVRGFSQSKTFWSETKQGSNDHNMCLSVSCWTRCWTRSWVSGRAFGMKRSNNWNIWTLSLHTVSNLFGNMSQKRLINQASVYMLLERNKEDGCIVNKLDFHKARRSSRWLWQCKSVCVMRKIAERMSWFEGIQIKSSSINHKW